MRSHRNQCMGDTEPGMGKNDVSPSSSIDSSSCPALSTTSLHQRASDLSTDLRLGLSLSTSSLQDYSSSKENLLKNSNKRHSGSFFVKVYMEGIPIGRKLDLYAHDGYGDLINALCNMFCTTIIFSGIAQVPSDKGHVVTYEDKDGDWMMVGDTPWELFLTTVRRLKVTRADKC